MHDPSTLAFSIRRLGIDVWHVDPETDGSDDSCGWSFVKPTDRDRKLAVELVDWDEKFPYFFAQVQRITNPEYPNLWSISPGDAATLVLELWHQIAWRLEKRNLTPADALAAMRLGHNQHDSFAGGFTSTTRDEQIRTILSIIRSYRTHRRPWWRHPRWHLHHWKINVQAIRSLKRCLFSRCAGCGKGFRWGYAPTTSNWNGTGPRWFRGESNVWHMECYHRATAPATAVRD